MTTPNFDTMLDRLHERQTERADDFNGYCQSCGTALTIVADLNAGCCTQCSTSLDVNDESVDEDLWEE